MNVKFNKLYSSLAKKLPIAEPSLGHKILAPVTLYYDLCYDKPRMNKKKFSLLGHQKWTPTKG